MPRRTIALPLSLVGLTACSPLSEVGRAPAFSTMGGTAEEHAVYSTPMPLAADPSAPRDAASLWTGQTGSLLGDRRAARRGDILTVIVEIDDKAQVTASARRNRSGSTGMGVNALFGLPQRAQLPDGASMSDLVDTQGDTTFSGSGDVSRQDKIKVRVAATIVEELANGVLRIEGSQEVRVNNELRELTLSGFVRPADISRTNEITYDRIAGARISYGGRGLVSEMQQPTYGQQLIDKLLPF